jgi:hypothetical protein
MLDRLCILQTPLVPAPLRVRTGPLVLNGWFMPLMFLTGVGALLSYICLLLPVFLTSDTMLSDTTS